MVRVPGVFMKPTKRFTTIILLSIASLLLSSCGAKAASHLSAGAGSQPIKMSEPPAARHTAIPSPSPIDSAGTVSMATIAAPNLTPDPTPDLIRSPQPISAEGAARINAYGALCFLDEKNGWVVNGVSLLKTADGGNTWITAGNLPNGVCKIDFEDAENGWALVTDYDQSTYKLTSYRVLYTADAGGDWTERFKFNEPASDASFDSNARFYDMWFADVHTGYVLCDGIIFGTKDGGANWANLSPVHTNFHADHISFISAEEGWAGGMLNGAPYIYQSDNGWTAGNLSGGDAAVFHTLDGGASWTLGWSIENNSRVSGIVSAMDFYDANNGWILLNNEDGISGTLYHTADGGKNFLKTTDMNVARPYVTSITFTGENTGWIATDHGAGPIGGGIMRSVDGGKTFAYVLGGDGKDGAEDDIGAIDNIAFPSAETGFATGPQLGNGSCLLGTTDGGNTWKQLSPITPINGISFVDDKNGFGIGTIFKQNAFLRTADGGAHWSVLPAPDLRRAPLTLSFINSQTGFVLCQNDASADGVQLSVSLNKTEDGGSTWIKIADIGGDLPEWGPPRYFRMFDAQNGIIVWFTEGVFWSNTTNDGGATWTRMARYTPPYAKYGTSPGTEFGTCAFSSADKGLLFLTDGKKLSVAVYNKGVIEKPADVYSPDSDWIIWNAAAYIGTHATALYCANNSGNEPAQSAFVLSGDSGATWKNVSVSPDLNDIIMKVNNNYNEHALSFADEYNGFLLAPGYSGLLVTADGGLTWHWR